jgi:hypothetical protein
MAFDCYPPLVMLEVMLHYNPGSHYQHKKYFRHKELSAVYASVFIKLLGESLISVFTAVFLLSRGYSVGQVGIYYVIYFSAGLFCMPLTRLCMQKFGVKKAMAGGIGILVVYYYLLRLVGHGIPYEFAALLYGLGANFYFTAFSVELTHTMHAAKKEGAVVAVVNIVSVLAAISGPIIGALFVTKLSFSFLFTVVSSILLLSLLPLFFTGDYKVATSKFSLKRVIDQGNKRRGLAYALNGATEATYDVLWPMFIYLNYRNYIAIGSIVSLTSLAMSIFIYFAGKQADRNNVQAYRTGVFANAPTWLIRLALLTPGGLLVSNFLGTATSYLVLVPYSKHLYHAARVSESPTDYFIFKEWMAWIGRVVALGAAIMTRNFTLVFTAITFVTLAQLILLPELTVRRQIKPEIISPTINA